MGQHDTVDSRGKHLGEHPGIGVVCFAIQSSTPKRSEWAKSFALRAWAFLFGFATRSRPSPRGAADTNSLAPAGLISFGTYTPRLRVWLYSRAASRLKRVFQRELHFPGRLCREDLTEQVITDIHECRDRARYRIRCGCNQRDKAVRHV